jgi:hypothetical protein
LTLRLPNSRLLPTTARPRCARLRVRGRTGYRSADKARRVNVPEKWQPYNCDDYYRSQLAQTGWWEPLAQCWYLERAEGVYEDEARQFLVIGRPGVDGIEWGYRRGLDGIWAHYPIENTFIRVAASADELRSGYADGSVTI